ncbi:MULTISPECIES: TetR/AcrR family transcriptional regulator [Allobranchiibius]|uniref:AcrR family transcriptional regulator n=1 Tax=Allobranchiibius huperziae TaxID=1874116 RepID=A0A853DQ09_9MICO|nr:TetR/AcrR family transcriptional regulator [Allobranchiibius sp. GilTou73]NYJ76205.1 AcrR family transcriptional regulator [Allobranchiibius huperziae]UIJ35700.1 TetR/AcrR family transcriptional regulator [Allobranchiibius sp. GilTou73]
MSVTAKKPLRADAARNRRLLIDTAADAFAANGVDVPLDDIARTAGVGIGTLYRHFPTREDLVLAVYAARVDDLAQRSDELARRPDSGEALHEWMREFVDFYAVKRGIIHLLRSMMNTNHEPFEAIRAKLLHSADVVLAPAIAAGVIRADTSATELTRALGGICLASTQPDADQVSMNLVDLIYDGLRYGTRA